MIRISPLPNSIKNFKGGELTLPIGNDPIIFGSSRIDNAIVIKNNNGGVLEQYILDTPED